jgi:hypothetical protein
VAWWIAALGLTVVGLTVWFVLARTSGGSSTGASLVGSSTPVSSVGSSTPVSSVGSGTIVPRARLTAGECFNYTSSATKFAVVPCQQPHDAQAYYPYTLPAGSFTGDQSIQDGAMATCAARFASYVDSLAQDLLTNFVMAPNQSEWAAGDRVVVCALFQFGRKIIGSAHQAH